MRLRTQDTDWACPEGPGPPGPRRFFPCHGPSQAKELCSSRKLRVPRRRFCLCLATRTHAGRGHTGAGTGGQSHPDKPGPEGPRERSETARASCAPCSGIRQPQPKPNHFGGQGPGEPALFQGPGRPRREAPLRLRVGSPPRTSLTWPQRGARGGHAHTSSGHPRSWSSSGASPRGRRPPTTGRLESGTKTLRKL